MFYRKEGKIKMFSDREKLKMFIGSRSALQELKEFLQAERV